MSKLFDECVAGGLPQRGTVRWAEPAAGDSDHRVQVYWLDLSVSLLQSGKLEVQAKINESEWACGKTETVGKHQVPPYVGPSGINRALLRGLIKGRAARFAQIGMRFRVLSQVCGMSCCCGQGPAGLLSFSDAGGGT